MTDEDKSWIAQELAIQLAQHLQQTSARLEEMSAKIEETNAKIERVESSLLTRFHKWASPNEMRARSSSFAIRALDLEFESLAERVKNLEAAKH